MSKQSSELKPSYDSFSDDQLAYYIRLSEFAINDERFSEEEHDRAIVELAYMREELLQRRMHDEAVTAALDILVKEGKLRRVRKGDQWGYIKPKRRKA